MYIYNVWHNIGDTQFCDVHLLLQYNVNIHSVAG